VAQIGEADDEEKKFASLMADQNRNYYFGRGIKSFLLPKI
jgi:hypothetical protein